MKYGAQVKQVFAAKHAANPGLIGKLFEFYLEHFLVKFKAKFYLGKLKIVKLLGNVIAIYQFVVLSQV
jgi:hypothetical protein